MNHFKSLNQKTSKCPKMTNLHFQPIGVRLAQVEKLYAGLKELANERRAKLDDALKLFMLNREVDDLEQWIAEREVVAGSHELGQDYDHVTLLWERFREFAKDTEMIGSERVNGVNEIADSLITSGHTGTEKFLRGLLLSKIN